MEGVISFDSNAAHEKTIAILEKYGEFLGDKELLKEDIDEITGKTINSVDNELEELGWKIDYFDAYEYLIKPLEDE